MGTGPTSGAISSTGKLVHSAEPDAGPGRAGGELAAFDASHPEVVAAIRAERQAAVERFLRAD